MECTVCGSTKRTRKYGSTFIPLCEDHNGGMVVSSGENSSNARYGTDVKLFFGNCTGGGHRVLKKSLPL